ncbi:alpha-amylase family protein [Saccharicrinis fermentans]|uniref:Alpha-amylase n=1 Tax=Saccharicrinis fermentans DSM 9555 = JCM 21142 TaxID=869213 RepID=W7YKR6_9BACT|nr:alpha-amylase family protein [Saccharicrinis fermentans]GAF02954.1 alpha-amylase precursor [Saccharicrinis fermentans DSM 9555 = JCM 21142]
MNKIVIYQALTRIFGNTNRTCKENGSIEDNGCGKMNDFTSKALQEIKKLGTTHIWYTGIIEHAITTNYSQYNIALDYHEVVKGKAGSPYAIKDYYDVNPDLAVDVNNRILEFEELVNRSHQEMLKVIIDFVPNHLARNYVSDAQPTDSKSFGEGDNINVHFDSNNNFYYLPGEQFNGPVTARSGQYFVEKPAKVTGNDCISAKPGINDWYETVKLNYGIDIFNHGEKHFDPIPDTWHKMLDILLYWSAKKIDGFRCDMAEMVPVEFWNWVIPKVKDKYPHIVFIAEVYNPELYRQYITYGGFDYLYDKVGMYDTLKAIIQGQQRPSAITKTWDVLNGIHQHMLFFLENHDEQRIASPFFAGDAKKAIPAMVVSGAIYSNPLMLYFGQELGVDGMDNEGYSGQDGRTSIFDYWGIQVFQDWVNDGNFDGALLTQETLELRNWYQNFLNIILKHDVIRQGEFYDLMWSNEDNNAFDSSKLYAFLRYYNKKILLIIVNFSDSKFEGRVKIPAHAFFTMGVESQKFFRGFDILSKKNKISFPQEVAITNGAGFKIQAYSGRIYELE